MGARESAVLMLALATGALAACGTTPAGASAGNSDPPSVSAGTRSASTGTGSGTPSSTTGGSTSGTPSSRMGVALRGIDPAKLPSTLAAVADVLAKLPATVDGHPVTERTKKMVSYADGTAVEAQPLEEAGGQDITMAQSWPHLEAGHPGDFKVTSHAGPGEPLLWLSADGEGPYGPYVAVVASRTGSWIFTFDAQSAKAANELLSAFKAALG